MAGDHQFQDRMARVDGLIRQLERTSDPAVRASVKELLQSVMDLHGAAVNRMLEIVYESGDQGARIIDSVGDDPLAGSLLILYGLHPQDMPARVARALEKLAPTFRKHGADVELEGVEQGVARLRIQGVRNATAGRALKTAIEEQIYALAPDVTRVEGLDALGVSDFVEIQNLTMPAVAGVTNVARLANGFSVPVAIGEQGD
jgi:Fe-S cluster biogenesis protein NfuA